MRAKGWAALVCASLWCACAPLDDETEEPVPGDELASTQQALVSGQPLPANATGFTYSTIDTTRCRNGSVAGVAARKTTSTSLVIYLEGGGACFDAFTCAANPNAIAPDHRAPPNAGIFGAAPSGQSNPFAGWNAAFVPYCTGDLHIGANLAPVDAAVDFGRSQYFHGRTNLLKILPSIKATFPNVTKVVLAGSSAGGAGTTGNALLVRASFPGRDFRMLDDAGPYMSHAGVDQGPIDLLPPKAQTRWRTLWGLDGTILSDCAACRGDNYFSRYARYVGDELARSGRKAALLTGKEDLVVSVLYGRARELDYWGGMVGVDMALALDDFRTRMGASWTTYYVTNGDRTRHTWLVGDEFYRTAVESRVGASGPALTLSSWVGQLVNGSTPGNYGP
jgi:hypothetical protein